MVDWGDVGKASWELLGPDVQAWKRLAPGGEKASLKDFGSAALDASILIPGVGIAGRTAGKVALKGGSKALGVGLKKNAAKAAGKQVVPKRAAVRDKAVRAYDKLDASAKKNAQFSSLKGDVIKGVAYKNTSKRVLGGKVLARMAANEARYGLLRDALAGGSGAPTGPGENPTSQGGGVIILGGGGGYGAAGVGGMATGAAGFGKLNNSARGDYVNL